MKSKTKRSPKPTTLCLPIFDARSALATINVLDAIITAIWTVHGDMIVEFQTDLTKVPVPQPSAQDPVEEIF